MEESRRLEEQRMEESRRLEESEKRNEQLRAEKERLMYDLQRRGSPLDDVDARSAIRRGLLAGPCHSSHTSDAGCSGPSDSLPASLPPGPPSSNSSGSVVAPIGSALSWGEADRPESATTAQSIYDEELEQAFADVAESERTPAPGTVEETMSRLHRAIWLAGRPNQEQHLLARCGCASSCSSQAAGQQEAAVLRINVNASPRLNPSALRQKFDELVMCDFTPRHPKDLPTSQWVSYPRLARLFQPHAPSEVWHKGPGNLRQLIVEWYKDDPTFAGLAENAWCKRVKINDPQEHPGSGTSTHHVYKFCFEYTPRHFPGL